MGGLLGTAVLGRRAGTEFGSIESAAKAGVVLERARIDVDGDVAGSTSSVSQSIASAAHFGDTDRVMATDPVVEGAESVHSSGTTDAQRDENVTSELE